MVYVVAQFVEQVVDFQNVDLFSFSTHVILMFSLYIDQNNHNLPYRQQQLLLHMYSYSFSCEMSSFFFVIIDNTVHEENLIS